MSVLVRDRSVAYRLRDGEETLAEHSGPLHSSSTVNTGDPLLEWGSISKTVTARISEQLAAAGTIDLDAPVTHYLPAAALPEEATVRTLLLHTAGLPRLPRDVFADVSELRQPYLKYTTEYFDAEVVPTLAAQHTGTVGTFEYSNLGYALLTRVLEVATGSDWWDLATREVFAPAGILDVTVRPDQGRTPVVRSWSGKPRAQWVDSGPFVGAGGIHGTFDALEHYARATMEWESTGVPLGWMGSESFWWHNGHGRDHGAFVGVLRDRRRIITVHTIGSSVGYADKVALRLHRRHRA